MIERCERLHRDEIKRAKHELEVASLQALRFLAAVCVQSQPTAGAYDPWQLVLLRVVNCVDQRAPQMARRVLVQALNSQPQRRRRRPSPGKATQSPDEQNRVGLFPKKREGQGSGAAYQGVERERTSLDEQHTKANK